MKLQLTEIQEERRAAKMEGWKKVLGLFSVF
jgi:hypothetical protein